jgi:hypothetical protein
MLILECDRLSSLWPTPVETLGESGDQRSPKSDLVVYGNRIIV